MGYNCVADEIEYDYIGCLYPIGFESDADVKLFNINNIQEVLFKGYNTDNFELLDEILIEMKTKQFTEEDLEKYEERLEYDEEEEYEVL